MKEKFQVAIGFNWRDIWIGIYIAKDRRTVFICPLPCIVIGLGYDAEKRVYGT